MKYFGSDEARKCVPTAYAIAQGTWTIETYSVGGKATCWWWLRSPGYDASRAAYVNTGGSVLAYGLYVDFVEYAVRPALWIEIGD